MMRIDLLSIFPEIFTGPLQYSIISRAQEKGLLKINNHDIRDYAFDKHRMVDDRPYGGGPGMIMKVEPIWQALIDIKEKEPADKEARVILLTPKGIPYNQKLALELAEEDWLILICGRYKGVDERVRQSLVTDEISIGDYVLTGGEIPALVVLDSVIRLLPGALGDEDSAVGDSFYRGILDHPHYTRPYEFAGMLVPDILLSGDHQKIEEWRQKESLRQTLRLRPDLLDHIELDANLKELLQQVKNEENCK